MEIFLEENQV